MHESVLNRIGECVREGRWIITLHAQQEMVADQITKKELELTLLGDLILVEDYPEDKRGHSHLILGNGFSTPIHTCCAVKREELFIITVYRPDAARWSPDWKVRE